MCPLVLHASLKGATIRRKRRIEKLKEKRFRLLHDSVKKKKEKMNSASKLCASLPSTSTVHLSNPSDFSASGVPKLQFSDKFRKYWDLSAFGFKGCIFILSLPQMLNEDLIQIVFWSELPGQCAVWGRGSVNPAAGGRLYFPRERLAHLGQGRLHTQFLDSLPSDRHLLSGRGERNILWLMSYGKTLAGCNRNPASVFLDFFHYFINIKVYENSVFTWGDVKVALWVILSEVIII